ncbi:MAG: hypothetical protein ACXVR0_17205 [Solirubrobacteraceae bacterium]
MGVIPKKTTPLTKFIRTGEGVLVFAFNLTMLIVPIVSNSLSPEDAVKWAGIVNGVAVISRTGLKVVAEVSKATGIEPQPIGDLPGQTITADAAGLASNGGAPEVVTGPTHPVVVMGPADPVVSDTASGGPSDDEEFASTPTGDDDAVDTPAAPEVGASADDDAVAVPLAPVVIAATGSTDPAVSDEEEFSNMPPASDTEDDGIVLEPASDNGDAVPEPVGAAAPGVPDPIVINGGEQQS